MDRPLLLFVTGKLAEPSLRRTLAALAPAAGFEYSIAVLPITVASLATMPWVARHLQVAPGVQKVILPGLCQGDLAAVETVAGVKAERGPNDLLDLPEYFSVASENRKDYGAFDIEILAEINHAPRLTLSQLLSEARRLQASGADVIDLGCSPGSIWHDIGAAVRALRSEGIRVSVDSFEPAEIGPAAESGAELVLSVNGSNLAAASDWGCEVVAVPDDIATLGGLDGTVENLSARGVPFRIDPIIEPIGFGFAASLGRYLEARRRYPSAEMMMGIGNLTELTDVDSAGINVILLAFCQELGIRSVLTTEVINWSRSSVRESDLARRLVHFACTRQILPKHLEPRLHLLRDAKLRSHGNSDLDDLAARIRDKNFRLFAENGSLHVMNDSMHLTGTDAFALFDEMARRQSIDPSHAFYLGYEMAKAVTALTLHKNYVQDQALDWGYLTVAEQSHRHKMPDVEDRSETAE
jgi:dihydropteroate synthase-like protein